MTSCSTNCAWQNVRNGVGDGGCSEDVEAPLESSLRRRPEHDVKSDGQLVNSGLLHGRKVHRHRLGRFRAKAAVDAVSLVPGMALDEKLRGPFLAPLHLYCEMDVRRGPHLIGHRLHGAKIIFPGRTGQEPAKTLEIGVKRPSARASPEVGAFAVYLPKLDHRISDGVTSPLDESSAQMRDFAYGRRDRIVNNQQVIIRVERKSARVERTFLNLRCARELLGKRARDREQKAPRRDVAEKTAARYSIMRCV